MLEDSDKKYIAEVVAEAMRSHPGTMTPPEKETSPVEASCAAHVDLESVECSRLHELLSMYTQEQLAHAVDNDKASAHQSRHLYMMQALLAMRGEDKLIKSEVKTLKLETHHLEDRTVYASLLLLYVGDQVMLCIALSSSPGCYQLVWYNPTLPYFAGAHTILHTDSYEERWDKEQKMEVMSMWHDRLTAAGDLYFSYSNLEDILSAFGCVQSALLLSGNASYERVALIRTGICNDIRGDWQVLV